MSFLTPVEIVERLDRYIVGQSRAKRSVAVALRNRWRRRQLSPELAADVYPKNILLIGPTGVGKTEIARRMADLANAPFLKVEASKYSEVGYHGRDVESMVRDLMETSFRIVRDEKSKEVRAKAKDAARDRVLAALIEDRDLDPDEDDPGYGMPEDEVQFVQDGGLWRPMIGSSEDAPAPLLGDNELAARRTERESARAELATRLDAGDLEDERVSIEVRDKSTPSLSIMGPQGTETMGIDTQALQEMWGRNPADRTKERKITVSEARRLIADEEAEALIDMDEVQQEAVERCENDGILFIDEVDKVVAMGGEGPDVSRGGVQRDLLTVIEGCTVYTKYGHVSTNHILFVAAGAFHQSKPSDLIPELQGRFPVRVALSALTEEDFCRILVEPRNSLTKQYVALLDTEGVTLRFTEEGIARIAAVAFKANKTTQNIGARRLMTALERLLEEISFDASEMSGSELVVDEDFVTERLGDAGDDPELIKYLL
ncbi:MAG: HslU--HslV peptidase ATPase subunit [Planctomycetes bacterium]|nr:HslU--HslV peptidase ATPase subunit [Planctomycetota bacterium]